MANSRKHILIVEDDYFSALLLKEYLRSFDVVVYEAKNGFEAYEICKNNQVDLVITDILMPVWDGMQLIKNLKKDNCKTKIIAQTAYGTKDKIDEIRKSGFENIILKPFRKEDFTKLVKDVLNSKNKVAES